MTVSISAIAASSFLADSASCSWLTPVIAFLNARARFLQRRFCLGDRCASALRASGAAPAPLSAAFNCCSALIERAPSLRASRRSARAAQHRLLACRFFRRALRAIAAVERIVQRQPIVALRDGVLCALAAP